MKVEIRKTAQGTEYWDTEAQKTLFVPAGKKPGFEVTKEPVTMIGGVDLATGEDMTVINSTMGIAEDNEKINDLSNMTIAQLKEYAADKDIKIPSDITKRDDIANYLYDNWNSDDE